MTDILVLANETIGGRKLLQAVLRRRDEAVYDAAQVRIDLARSVLHQEGIDAIGEPGDPDPYTAAMDAIARG